MGERAMEGFPYGWPPSPDCFSTSGVRKNLTLFVFSVLMILCSWSFSYVSYRRKLSFQKLNDTLCTRISAKLFSSFANCGFFCDMAVLWFTSRLSLLRNLISYYGSPGICNSPISNRTHCSSLIEHRMLRFICGSLRFWLIICIMLKVCNCILYVCLQRTKKKFEGIHC